MLGCGAHVRKIALPHVRCACESACGKGLKLCVQCACVRLVLGCAMCDHTFAHFLQQNGLKICYFSTFSSHFKTYKDVLKQKGCSKTQKEALKQNWLF